ncbi:MAG: Protein-L-isoaspartate(D-aspartate) O-methyltransferase, partial [Parcubacteria group bacterium GW2011_GWA2_45_30]
QKVGRAPKNVLSSCNHADILSCAVTNPTNYLKFNCLDATADIPPGPYDKIIAAAAASKDIPQSWRNQLKIGGCIVAPVGGSIRRFTKRAENDWMDEEFPGFAFVPLIGDR